MNLFERRVLKALNQERLVNFTTFDKYFQCWPHEPLWIGDPYTWLQSTIGKSKNYVWKLLYISENSEKCSNQIHISSSAKNGSNFFWWDVLAGNLIAFFAALFAVSFVVQLFVKIL
jgi:hypothetical protein